MNLIQTAIIDLMTAHPTLSSAGIHFRSHDKNWHDPEYFKTCRDLMLTDRFFKGVQLSEDYIRQHGIKRGMTSYGLKHLVEEEYPSTYIHNGAFIIAAILRGYVPVLHQGPNPSFRKLSKTRPELSRGDSK